MEKQPIRREPSATGVAPLESVCIALQLKRGVEQPVDDLVRIREECVRIVRLLRRVERLLRVPLKLEHRTE